MLDKVSLDLLSQDMCPKCKGELDTGWECNDCGEDWIFYYMEVKRQTCPTPSAATH